MVIKMYFRLNPECYFIRGETCGTILDLIDEKIYILNQEETKIIIKCEKNEPVTTGEELLEELKRLRLGNYYPNRIYMQKLRLGSPFLTEYTVDLYRAFLEINNVCNRDCWFCGYHGINRSLGCMGCNKWKESGRTLEAERWKEIIDELRDLYCKDIYIIGGDLTLAWNKTMTILDYADKKFDNIYMILHQQSLSQDKINDLDDRVKLIVQTEDLNRLNSHDFLTLQIVKTEGEKNVSSLGRDDLLEDFIIDKKSFSKDLPIISRRKVKPVNLIQFYNNVKNHPCMGHTLAISYNGKVLPCPMMRMHSFGNVLDRYLYTILKDKWDYIQKFWRMNLDNVEKCTSCEFRYNCSDCRALEESLTGRLYGKKLCRYDPKEGDWL